MKTKEAGKFDKSETIGMVRKVPAELMPRGDVLGLPLNCDNEADEIQKKDSHARSGHEVAIKEMTKNWN